MGLWVHKDGELKRTVPGKHEDKRVTESPEWRPITPAQLAELRAASEPAKVVAGLFADKGQRG